MTDSKRTIAVLSLIVLVGALSLTGVRQLDAQGPRVIPRGVIVMWSGSTVPSDWCLLDGTDNSCPTGAPNLGGLFVMGSGSGNQVGPASTVSGNPETKLAGGHTPDLYEDNGVVGTRPGPPYYPTQVDIHKPRSIYRHPAIPDHSHEIDEKQQIPPHYVLSYIMKL